MDLSTNERLASLEAKLEILKELLKEIRDDVKNSPTRSEFEDLKERVDLLEKSSLSTMVKIGAVAGALGIISGFLGDYLIKLLG